MLNFAISKWTPECAGDAILQIDDIGRYIVRYGSRTAFSAVTIGEAIEFVRTTATALRQQVLPSIQAALPGWPPDTPVLGTTLDRLTDVPIVLRAAPPARSAIHGRSVVWMRIAADGTVLEHGPDTWLAPDVSEESRATYDAIKEAERSTNLAERQAVVDQLLSTPGIGACFDERGRLPRKKPKPVATWTSPSTGTTHTGTLSGDAARQAGTHALVVHVTGRNMPQHGMWVRADLLRLVDDQPQPRRAFARTSSVFAEVRADRVLGALYNPDGQRVRKTPAYVRWHDPARGCGTYSELTGAFRRSTDGFVEMQVRRGGETLWVPIRSALDVRQ
ncbi:MAG TPA: hypothetical protein VF292_02780 [Rhodanobacteraceae bacterium]